MNGPIGPPFHIPKAECSTSFAGVGACGNSAARPALRGRTQKTKGTQYMITEKEIKAGQVLVTRSPCDHDCIFRVEILSRQKSFVTVKTLGNTKRVKVYKDDDGEEYIYALGKYSMCPIFRASRQEVSK